jgi:hypothetical protein
MQVSTHFVCLEDITHGAGIRSNSGQGFHRHLFWRLKFALQPAYYLICFKGIGAVAIETLERARTFAAWRQRQNQKSPAMEASRPLGLSHDANNLSPLIRHGLFGRRLQMKNIPVVLLRTKRGQC